MLLLLGSSAVLKCGFHYQTIKNTASLWPLFICQTGSFFFGAVFCPSSPELSAPYHQVTNFFRFFKLSPLTRSHLLVCLCIPSPGNPCWRFRLWSQCPSTLLHLCHWHNNPDGSRNASCVLPRAPSLLPPPALCCCFLWKLIHSNRDFSFHPSPLQPHKAKVSF